MNSLYGVQIRKDFFEFYKCTLQNWTDIDNDGNVLHYCRLPKGIYIVKWNHDDGLNDENNLKNTSPSHLGAFILSKS